MRLGILPKITQLSEKRPSLGRTKGIVIEHLKVGDKIGFKSSQIGNATIEVKEIELGKIGFTFSGLRKDSVVYDTTGSPVIENGQIRTRVDSPNVSNRRFMIKQLDNRALQSLLRPNSLAIVPQGLASELLLFLDYSCPSTLTGTVCNIGIALPDNEGKPIIPNALKLSEHEIITSEKKDFAQVNISLST